MADPNDTVVLNVDVAKGMTGVAAFIKQIEGFESKLEKIHGPEALKVFFNELASTLKTQQLLLKGYASSLSTVGQKFNQTQQTASAAVERTATAIGIAARQYERAIARVTDAEKAGKVSDFAKVRALSFKTAADASAAYRGQLRQLQAAIVELDAIQNNTGARNAKLVSIDREAAAAAALKQRITELTAVEKEEGAVAANIGKARAAFQKEATAATRLRFDQELEGLRRNAAYWDLYWKQQVDGAKRSAAEYRELAAAQRSNQPPVAATPATQGAPTNTLAARFAGQAARLINYAALGAAIGGGAAVIAQVVKLDEALHNLQGITQTSDAGMGLLRDKILEVSAASKFMASDVANAATILGQAGLSATQIADSLKAVVVFAQGAGTSLDESVNLITAAMGAFNLRASESMAVANTFTAALNNSKLTVQQLSVGFQYSATAAAQLGMSYTELVTTMQLMADAGIKSGSMIGTGIRQILNQLAAPNQKLQQILLTLGVSLNDVDVKSHGLAQVMETLKNKGFDATDAFAAFGTRGAGAFIALSSQVDNFYEKMAGNTGTNAAIKAADTQMQSLANTARNTGAEIAAAASKGFQPLLRSVTGLISVVGQFFAVMQKLGPVIEIAATALGVFGTIKAAQYIVSITKMAEVTSLFTKAVASLELAALVGIGPVEALGTVAAAVFGPVTIAVVALTAAIVAYSEIMGANAEAQSKAAAATEAANGKLQEAKTTYETSGAAIEMLINRQKDLTNGSAALKAAAADLGQRFQDLGLDVNKLSGDYDGLIARMREIRGLALKQQGAALTDMANQNRKLGAAKYGEVSSLRSDVLSAASSAPVNQGISAYPQVAQLTALLKAGVPTTSADQAKLASSLAQIRGIDQSQFSGAQSSALDKLINSADKLLAGVGGLTKIYSGGGSIELQRAAVALRGSSGFQAAQARVEATHSTYIQGLPNLTGQNSLADQMAAAKYETETVKQLTKELADAKKYAAADAAHAAAAAPLIKEITSYLGDIATSDKKLAKSSQQAAVAKETYNKRLQGATLETATQALGQARTVADAKAAYGKIQTAQREATKAAVTKVATDKGLREGIDFTVANDGTVTFAHPERVQELTSLAIKDTQLTQQQIVQQQQQSFEAKIGSITRRETTAADAAARALVNGVAANVKTVVQDQIKALNSDIARLGKSFNKYDPIINVNAAYDQIIEDIRQIVILKLQELHDNQKKLKDLGEPVMTAEELKAAEDAINDVGTDQIGQVQDKRKEDLSGGERLPASFVEAWQNIQKFAADARKTIGDNVNELATMFQDVMQAAITSVKSSLATFWTSIIEGTQSVGQALKAFAKSILESIANALTANLAQKAVNWVMGMLPGGAGSTETPLITSNTVLTAAINANTLAVNANTAAKVGGSIPGLGGGTPSGDVTELGIPGSDSGATAGGAGATGAATESTSWFSKIGDFFTNLFSKISDFLSSLMSQLGSILSNIGSSIGSAASGAGDWIASLFEAANSGGVIGRAAGGLIPGSLPTRDSVYKPLNVGDFVMRSTAVRNIGLPALHAINSLASGGKSKTVMTHLTPGEFAINRTSAKIFGYRNLDRMNFDGSLQHLAAGGMAGMGVSDVLGGHSGNRMDAANVRARDPFANRLKSPGQNQHHSTTNVWVVKPEERPPTTKQDIVVAISEDILSNGTTKKLIKSIQAGG